MNAPVDVLAVMDELVCTDLAALTHEQAQDFWAARAAIAELIEAVRGGVETRTHNGFVMHYDEVQADRLAAALARVGGGK